MMEVKRYDWASLRAADDPNQLPKAIYELANSTDKAVIEKAYWSIDNVAVVQGPVFQSAIAVRVIS